jgi:hypothetical protein
MQSSGGAMRDLLLQIEAARGSTVNGKVITAPTQLKMETESDWGLRLSYYVSETD